MLPSRLYETCSAQESRHAYVERTHISLLHNVTRNAASRHFWGRGIFGNGRRWPCDLLRGDVDEAFTPFCGVLVWMRRRCCCHFLEQYMVDAAGWWMDDFPALEVLMVVLLTCICADRQIPVWMLGTWSKGIEMSIPGCWWNRMRCGSRFISELLYQVRSLDPWSRRRIRRFCMAGMENQATGSWELCAPTDERWNLILRDYPYLCHASADL